MRSRFLPAVLLATILTSSASQAQRPGRAAATVDSTTRRCLEVGWLHAAASCEGRLLNAATLTMAGASAGAFTGLVGGLVAPTACLGRSEQNALRGAIAGAALGAVTGMVTRHVSRRDRAARDARDRARARRDPPRPWSWRDARPAVAALGTVATAGAVIGGVQGSRHADRCGGGRASGAATGAGVYAAAGATTMVGALLVVRFLF